jgi:hypothetical protein
MRSRWLASTAFYFLRLADFFLSVFFFVICCDYFFVALQSMKGIQSMPSMETSNFMV